MDRARIEKLLPHLNSKPIAEQNRTGWVISSCPYAPYKHSDGIDQHPSFGIRIVEAGLSDYHCFSCNSHGELMDLALELKRWFAGDKPEGYNLRKAVDLIMQEEEEAEISDIPDYENAIKNSSETIPFSEHWLNTFKPWHYYPAAKTYLQSREVGPELANALDLRYDSRRQRVGFPIRQWNGELVGYHGRDVTGKEYPYHAYKVNNHWNKLPWCGENHINVDQTIVLCESVFDYASIYRIYRNVMCSLSAGIGYEKCKRIASCLDVVTFYDHGTGGDTARSAISKHLKHSALVDVIPTKEQGDPGNMSIPELKQALGDLLDFDVTLL